MGKDLIEWDYSQNRGIVWRRPITNKDKGFVVKQYEHGLFYKGGQLIELFSGGTHKLNKKEKQSSEIIYVTTTNIKINWGIPRSQGIFTNDSQVGCNGTITLKITDPDNFVSNVVVAAARKFIGTIEKDTFIKGEKKRVEIVKDKLKQDEITVETAIRDKSPFLYSEEDLQEWIIDSIKNILKDKMGNLSTATLIRGGVQKDELIKEIRAKS
ncbi:MAG: hypothetical protein ACFFCM_17010, partial [Promethearchaeota archaeon]